ncbi:MAG: class I SAM-dependent methyltransferase [Candidatus Altiarchaeota archaeon]|nr:class I SAM-dependent methyltransferase [Candidatus Altiarchaeota archaeon]
MLDKKTKKTGRVYDRIAPVYDKFEAFIERKLFKNLRQKSLENLKGQLLEIGVGTGKNLQYYTTEAKVIAIDISPKMLERAKNKAKKLGKDIEFHLMDAQELKFKDNSFDFVIGTFVLCSIPNPIKALKEVQRVLKKGGKAIFLEHVLSKNKLIALLEHLHNPITSGLFGFNVNRNTRKNILNAGINIVSDEELAFFDVFRKFTCTKGG